MIFDLLSIVASQYLDTEYCSNDQYFTLPIETCVKMKIFLGIELMGLDMEDI